LERPPEVARTLSLHSSLFVRQPNDRGCAKVRYYGLWSVAHRVDRTRAGTPDGRRSPGDAAGARTHARVICRRPPAVSALSRGHSDRPRRAPTVVDAATMTTLLTPRSATCLNTPAGREGRRVADRPYPHISGVADQPRRHSPPRPPHRQIAADRLPDSSPHPCHSLTRDKNPNRNARARISSNPGLCRGFARHESFFR